MKRLFVVVDRLIVGLSSVFIAVAIALLAVMAVIGTADVLGLNLFGRPVPSATEFASSMLALTVMLSMSYAQRTRSHIVVDIVSRHFPPRLALLSAGLSLVLGVLVFGLLSWGAWELALHSTGIRERAVAAIRFPVWPIKIAFAFGATVCTLELLRELVRLVVTREIEPDQPVTRPAAEG